MQEFLRLLHSLPHGYLVLSPEPQFARRDIWPVA